MLMPKRTNTMMKNIGIVDEIWEKLMTELVKDFF